MKRNGTMVVALLGGYLWILMLALSGCRATSTEPAPSNTPLATLDQVESLAKLYIPSGYKLKFSRDVAAPQDWFPGGSGITGLRVHYQPTRSGLASWAGARLTFMPKDFVGTPRENDPNMARVPQPDRDLGIVGGFRVFYGNPGPMDKSVSAAALAKHFGVKKEDSPNR